MTVLIVATKAWAELLDTVMLEGSSEQVAYWPGVDRRAVQRDRSGVAVLWDEGETVVRGAPAFYGDRRRRAAIDCEGEGTRGNSSTSQRNNNLASWGQSS